MNTLWHDAFYRFARVDDPPRLVTDLETVCRDAGVLGSVLVAYEGINGMLSGTADQLGAVRAYLATDERFQDLDYKRTPCQTPPFTRLRIREKPEIVPLGVTGVDATQTGTDLSAAEWRALIAQDDVIVIDNRNRFEYALGHFRGAVDPGVHNFRDFAAYARTQLGTWQGKRVAMYCTGGIRCEKSSAWLRSLGLEIYQLKGGILAYFDDIEDASSDFEGECFVFDDRVSLSTDLEETGRSLEDVTDLQIDLARE